MVKFIQQTFNLLAQVALKKGKNEREEKKGAALGPASSLRLASPYMRMRKDGEPLRAAPSQKTNKPKNNKKQKPKKHTTKKQKNQETKKPENQKYQKAKQKTRNGAWLPLRSKGSTTSAKDAGRRGRRIPIATYQQ